VDLEENEKNARELLHFSYSQSCHQQQQNEILSS